MILNSGNSMMNKRRRSSSVATISDESNEFATPDRETSPTLDGDDGSTTNNASGSTTILVSSSSARKRKKLDPVSRRPQITNEMQQCQQT